MTAEGQPGSSFKPYVYEKAFQEGAISPTSTVDDTRQESQKLGGVNDWDRQFIVPMPAWQALLLSRNGPTEQVMEKAGTENVINFAHTLGITSSLADNASTGATMCATGGSGMVQIPIQAGSAVDDNAVPSAGRIQAAAIHFHSGG